MITLVTLITIADNIVQQKANGMHACASGPGEHSYLKTNRWVNSSADKGAHRWREWRERKAASNGANLLSLYARSPLGGVDDCIDVNTHTR